MIGQFRSCDPHPPFEWKGTVHDHEPITDTFWLITPTLSLGASR